MPERLSQYFLLHFRRNTMKITHFVAIAALALGTAGAAFASPITGAIGIGGSDTWNTTTINFSNPGVVTSAVGDFSTIPLFSSATTIGSFDYALTGPESVTIFTTAVDGASLIVNQVTSSSDTGDTLTIKGNGTLDLDGYDPTVGTFIITSSNTQGAISFEATAGASPVPEPASLALFGTGLLGVVGIARRKFKV
jgi:hypothetical protein